MGSGMGSGMEQQESDGEHNASAKQTITSSTVKNRRMDPTGRGKSSPLDVAGDSLPMTLSSASKLYLHHFA